MIALVLVVGSYYATRGVPETATLSAAETEEVLKEYAAKDTDQDGVPDWQELLYKTDPADPNSVRSDVSDAEAIAEGLVEVTLDTPTGSVAGDIIANIPGKTPAPGSLTEKFALAFFETYATTGGGQKLSDSALRAFINGAVEEVRANATRADAYDAGDVTASSAATPSAYLAEAGRAFSENAREAEESELIYFSDAVLKGDTKALEMVRRSGEHYTAIAGDLIEVAPPSALSSAHLALANSVARLGATIADMATLADDPVRAMIGFGNYEKDAHAFAAALAGMKTAYDATGAAKTGAGASFYALLTIGAEAAKVTP